MASCLAGLPHLSRIPLERTQPSEAGPVSWTVAGWTLRGLSHAAFEFYG